MKHERKGQSKYKKKLSENLIQGQSKYKKTPSESLPCRLQGNFAAVLVLNYRLREFLFSAFANHFEVRCEPKQLMLLYYKIFPCLSNTILKMIKTTNSFHGRYKVNFPNFLSFHSVHGKV